jgi:hypothetical protein
MHLEDLSECTRLDWNQEDCRPEELVQTDYSFSFGIGSDIEAENEKCCALCAANPDCQAIWWSRSDFGLWNVFYTWTCNLDVSSAAIDPVCVAPFVDDNSWSLASVSNKEAQLQDVALEQSVPSKANTPFDKLSQRFTRFYDDVQLEDLSECTRLDWNQEDCRPEELVQTDYSFSISIDGNDIEAENEKCCALCAANPDCQAIWWSRSDFGLWNVFYTWTCNLDVSSAAIDPVCVAPFVDDNLVQPQ